MGTATKKATKQMGIRTALNTEADKARAEGHSGEATAILKAKRALNNTWNKRNSNQPGQFFAPTGKQQMPVRDDAPRIAKALKYKK